jgi:cellulose synthase/poly-beta-1,6-N-acetylglucosamine synthase-like glycosyltransferase
MLFRRRALNEAGNFDESIQYSFEEDELIDRVCRAGYKVVVDPQVTVWHKHRSKLRSLLGQSFKYGKGTGKLLKKPHKKQFFRRWLIADFGIVAQTIAMIVLGAFFVLMGRWSNFFLFFSATFLVPFIVLIAIYGFRALLNRERGETMFYPWIDFLRVLAFMAGEFYGFIVEDPVL